MKLYREVPITSAEQAEALPIGTIVRSKVGTFLEKGRFDRWWHGSYQRPHPGVIGWTALVPVEAEEEHTIWKSWEGTPNGLGIPVPPDYPFHDLAPGEAVHTRLVTPWGPQD